MPVFSLVYQYRPAESCAEPVGIQHGDGVTIVEFAKPRPVMVSALAVQASASSMVVNACRSAYICDDHSLLHDATVCRYQLSIPSASLSLAICASFPVQGASSFSSLAIEAGALSVSLAGGSASDRCRLFVGFVTRTCADSRQARLG